MWALRDAVDRGVKIRILTERDVTEAKPVKYASRDAFERLLALGIELHASSATSSRTFASRAVWIWSSGGGGRCSTKRASGPGAISGKCSSQIPVGYGGNGC